MHRWRSALLLAWTIAILAPLAGTSRLLAAEQLSAISAAGTAGAHVTGKAVFTSANGAAHTCQIGEAILVPADSHARTVVLSFFGDTRAGHIKDVNYWSLLEQIGPAATHADCDKDGHFEFTNVTPGSYFVLGRTLWFARWAHDGRILMRSVDIKDTVQNDVVLRNSENP